MYGDLAGRTQVFTEGSIRRDGSAAAACIVPQLRVEQQCRLWFCSYSTKAELVGLLLAADLLRESPAITIAAKFSIQTCPEPARQGGPWLAPG
ncbi:hypothetical protein MRX96_059113 [Rhipicephalus microplus]